MYLYFNIFTKVIETVRDQYDSVFNRVYWHHA